MTSSVCCTKLLTLVWKCWRLQHRQPAMLAFDAIVTMVYVIALAIVRIKIPPNCHPDVSTFLPYSPLRPLSERQPENKSRLNIAWNAESSSENFAGEARQVMTNSFSDANVNLKEFSRRENMENYLMNNPGILILGHDPAVLCGVILQDTTGSGRLCSKGLQLTLRFPGELREAWTAEEVAKPALGSHLRAHPGPRTWRTDRLFPLYESYEPHPYHAFYYYYERFLTMQFLISKEIVKYCGGNSTLANSLSHSEVMLREFSYPPYMEDPLGGYMEYFLPLLLYVSLANPRIGTIRSITTEKEQQLKEVMKIMGMANSLYWTSWVMKTVMYLSLYAILLLFILKADFIFGIAVIPKSDFSLVLFFLFLYMMATTCFCCMVSAFFTNATKASLVGRLLWVGTLVPFMTFVKYYNSVSLTMKILASLCLNSGMALGALLIVKSELTGKGMKWRGVCVPVTPDDDLTLTMIIAMLTLDSMFYMLVALYVDTIYAGKYGISRPWKFIFSKMHWLGDDGPKMSEEVVSPDPERIEPPPVGLLPAVQTRHLCKVFDKDRIVVNDLTLNLYEGQITVLLGHNGAGKSTAICMLAGMYAPTSGHALIRGHDIVRETSLARDSLGICLQHDVLFQELTVRDHLYFFSKLKGLRGMTAKAEVKKYLEALDLKSKEHYKAKRLSAGARRKLQAGVALCGHSKVVLLDEPTCGMDPVARRSFWDLLLSEKPGRAVLLSTQSMQEADVLADRIAIMAHGRLQAYGSPLFLKQRYDAGCRLVVETGPRNDEKLLTEMLRRYVPNLPPPDVIGNELSYRLENEPAVRLQAMFRALERRENTFDIREYGFFASTMDEVYFKACKELEEREAINQRLRGVAGTVSPLPRWAMWSGVSMMPKMGKGNLRRQRLHALLAKKWCLQRRDWVLFLLHLTLPTVFIIAFTEGSRSAMKVASDPPPLQMRLKEYPRSITTTTISKDAKDSEDLKDMRDLYEGYKSIVLQAGPSHKLRDLGYSSQAEKTLDAFILEQFGDDKVSAGRPFVVGATFDNAAGRKITAWYGSLPMHSAPLSLNLVVNAFMSSIDVSLTVVNHPLPLTQDLKDKLTNEQTQTNVQRSVSFAMTFVVAYYVLLPVKERVNKAKLLQIVSGASATTFWMVQFACDALSLLLPMSLVLITLFVYQTQGFVNAVHLERLFVILICFGWAALPFTYLVSFAFKQPSTGYNVVMTIYLYFGVGLYLGVEFLLANSPNQMIVLVAWFILVLPHYCLSDALAHFIENEVYKKFCEQREPYCSILKEDYCCPGKCPITGCVKYMHDAFSMQPPGIGRNLVFFFFSGICYMTITLVIEYRHNPFLRRVSRRNKKRAKIERNGSKNPHR